VAGAGVGVADIADGSELGATFVGEAPGDVDGPGDPAVGEGEMDGLGESGGDAIVGVHFTRVGLGVGLLLGGAAVSSGDGESVGDGDGDAVAEGDAAGVRVAAATKADGVLVGPGPALSSRAAAVPAKARITRAPKATASLLERRVVRSRRRAVQAEASVVLMTAPC